MTAQFLQIIPDTFGLSPTGLLVFDKGLANMWFPFRRSRSMAPLSRRRFRPVLEPLEDRLTPTANVVDLTTASGANALIAPQVSTSAVGQVSLSQSTISVSPSLTIQSGNTVTVTLTALDANGNQETSGGLQVAFNLGMPEMQSGSFSAVTDKNDGTYTATFTAGNASFNNFIATINGQDVTSAAPEIRITPGPVSLDKSFVYASAALLDVGETTQVAMMANDANFNSEGSGGLAVAFSLGNPNVGTLSPVTDNQDGLYTATFTAKTAGSTTVSATIGGNTVLFAVPTITVVLGPSGKFYSDVPTFSWMPLTGQLSDELWVTDNTTHKVLTVPNLPASATSYTLTTAQALVPGDDYTWWVGAVQSGNSITWGAPTSFSLGVIGAPLLS